MSIDGAGGVSGADAAGGVSGADGAGAALAESALAAAHGLLRAAAGIESVAAGLVLPAAGLGWTGVAAGMYDAAVGELTGRAADLGRLTGAAAATLQRHSAALLDAAADEVDERLRRLRADLDEIAAEALLIALGARDGLGAVLHTALPDGGAGAEGVHRWWTTLPLPLRARLAPEHPDLLGGLAGVPVAVRSASNERLLAADLRRWALPRGPLSVEQARELLAVRATAEQLSRARAARDPVTGALRGAALLVYDPAFSGGEGRVALVLGDAASAEHVAFLVPGLDSDVGGDLTSLTDDAGRLADAASLDAPGERTAVVAWMGYDAPELSDVALEAPAVLGARLLAADVRAVAATRGPVHVTVVGHSYGSTTAAGAAREQPTEVDDLVLMGSPGAGARQAGDLLPGRHVYVAADSRDPVSWLGWFGPDPAGEEFGAVRLPAQSADGAHGLSFAAHSGYLDAGSESLHAVSHVVVGDVAELRRTPPRDQVLWGLLGRDPESGRRGATYGFDRHGLDVRTG